MRAGQKHRDKRKGKANTHSYVHIVSNHTHLLRNTSHPTKWTSMIINAIAITSLITAIIMILSP